MRDYTRSREHARVARDVPRSRCGGGGQPLAHSGGLPHVPCLPRPGHAPCRAAEGSPAAFRARRVGLPSPSRRTASSGRIRGAGRGSCGEVLRRSFSGLMAMPGPPHDPGCRFPGLGGIASGFWCWGVQNSPPRNPKPPTVKKSAIYVFGTNAASRVILPSGQPRATSANARRVRQHRPGV